MYGGWSIDWDAWKWVVEKLIVPLFIPFLVFLYAVIQLVEKRRIEFREKQLTEFYAPMLAIRQHIYSDSVFHLKLRQAHGGTWLDVVNRLQNERNPIIWDKEFEPFKRRIDSSNEHFMKDTLPLYRKMGELLRDKYAYADADVREWFMMFYAFVETWNVTEQADEKKDVAPGTVSKVAVNEEKLKPFYDLLEERTNEIQVEILRPWWQWQRKDRAVR